MKQFLKTAIVLFTSLVTYAAQAETLYTNAPWIVESSIDLNGEQMCSIAVMSPLGYGLTIERGRSQTTVQVFDIGKSYTPDEKVMWVVVGKEIYMWDGFRSGQIAMTAHPNDDDRTIELLSAIGTTPRVGIGTFRNPTVEFPSPRDDTAKEAFQTCVNGL